MKYDSFNVLFTELTQDTLVLTPNARLTLTLHKAFKAKQTRNVWPTPNILPLTQWLVDLWRKAQFSVNSPLPMLLSDDEEDCLWRQALHENNHHFYSLDNFAAQLKTAWTHCYHWCLPIDKSTFSYNEETFFFYRIVNTFLTKTRTCQPRSNLMHRIKAVLEKKPIRLPQTIVLAYFDELTPLQTQFFQLLEEQGVNLHHFDTRIKTSTVTRFALTTKDEETRLLLHWLKQSLTEGKNNIAVVVPDLHARREELERELLSNLPKDTVNFSIGKPLTEFCLVNNALALLAMKDQLISLKDLHLLMFSTFIGGADKEFEQRASCYQTLTQNGDNYFLLSQIIKALDGTRLFYALKNMTHIESSGKHSLTHWVHCFQQCLHALGFPGDALLNSEAYQTLNKLYQIFDALLKLETHLPVLSYESALEWLRWLCNKTVFQAQAKNENIQVLGLLEALGLQFDAVWIMGLTNQQLPNQTKPSPFIPLYLQQQHTMPHATAKREYQYAELALNRLCESAPNVIVSAYLEDNTEQYLASPLIEHHAITPHTLPEVTLTRDVETYLPHYIAPAVNLKDIRGGTFILKEQARCPFRAFSRFRLGIKDAREPSDGLDELDRGILVHEVLEHFWREVKTHAQLLTLSQDACDAIVLDVIKRAIGHLETKHPVTLTPMYKQLETHRLKKLLDSWLEIERKRAPFSVMQIEEKQHLSLGELDLTMRVDRIDTLDNGDKIVIDYKTGLPTVSDWFSERIEEPQLPLYSLTDEHIKGLAFASLKSQECKIKGVSENDLGIKGVKTLSNYGCDTFSEQRELWKVRLTAISEEFIRGEITPQPSKDSLCQQCGFKSLCGKLR